MSKYQPADRLGEQILGVRIIQNHGRVQVPKEVRVNLQIKDGDTIIWIRTIDGKFAIVKSGRF